MAEVAQENIKEKVSAVREVVPGKSNNEIVLVLQFYDYNVERAIQAYVEDGAKQALTEWHFSGNKAPNKKKKNKKNKNSQASSVGQANSLSTNQKSDAVPNHNKETLTNGDVHNDVTKNDRLLKNGQPVLKNHETTVLESKPVSKSGQPQASNVISDSQPKPQRSHPRHDRQTTHSGSHSHGSAHSHNRQQTISERSMSSVGQVDDNHIRKPFAGLEKCTKDLQRQTTSLERLRINLDGEIEKGYKWIKTVFEEARKGLKEREDDLVKQMDAVKAKAYDVFAMRRDKAADLRRRVERAERLSSNELAELRADIKLFVSDRKIDEDLCRSTRFTYDSDHFLAETKKFGEVVAVSCPYNARRPSVSSVASSGVGHDDAPSSPTSSGVTNSFESMQLSGSRNHSSNTAAAMSTTEIAELQQRLKNSLQLQGVPVSSSPPRNRPASAPVQKSRDESEDFRKSKTARRRQRQRERDRGTETSEMIVEESSTDKSQSVSSQRQSVNHEKEENGSERPNTTSRSPDTQRGGSPRRNYSRGQQNPGRYSSGPRPRSDYGSRGRGYGDYSSQGQGRSSDYSRGRGDRGGRGRYQGRGCPYRRMPPHSSQVNNPQSFAVAQRATINGTATNATPVNVNCNK